MTEEARIHWDDRYAGMGPAAAFTIAPPTTFAPHEHLFPTRGHALEIACGQGRAAVWLARRGLDVWGLDISPVAVNSAQELAARVEVDSRCRFDVVDLDGGLPDGPLVDLILCHLFRDSSLDQLLLERLAPGGMLAIAALSEVDVGPGRFRVAAGELHAAFANEINVVAEGEQDGHAWLLGRA